MISDVSIPNGEDDNDTDGEEQEYGYANMELGLLRRDDDGLMHAIVNICNLDDEFKDAGTMNKNPMLDTRVYEVEFADGTTEFITANIIANNLLAQVNEEGHLQVLLDNIIDHIVRQWAHIDALITWLTVNGNSCCLRLNYPPTVGT